MFNILYKGRKIYNNLTFEECTNIFDDLAHKFYEGEDIDLNEIEMEEI
jgi:hypothetical protein